MPRIYDGNSDPHDFCRVCFPKPKIAWMRFGSGTGPDHRGNCYGYDEEHPPYDGEDYRCEKCGRQLTGVDDYVQE